MIGSERLQINRKEKIASSSALATALILLEEFVGRQVQGVVAFLEHLLVFILLSLGQWRSRRGRAGILEVGERENFAAMIAVDRL